ncbi:MAG: hypothetical protein NTY02_15325, partial [Acidobacteria bacterium]|nr:hypothetical protein [Acidobacteriota bacterium]
MSRTQRECVAGLGLCLAMAVMAAGCTDKAAAPGADTAAARTAPAPVDSTGVAPQAAGTNVPAQADAAWLSDKIAGWTRDGAVQRFGPGNLWEYIDGGAEQFLAFGFHNPKHRAIEVGVQGRAGTNSAAFWTGSSYVKLVARETRDDAPVLLPDLARAVAARLGEPGELPAELDVLPRAKLVPGSMRLDPADALGQQAFTEALEAQYEATPKPITLVMVPFETVVRAAAALKDYGAFLAQSGAPRELVSPAGGGFAATDGYHGRVTAIRSGRW